MIDIVIILGNDEIPWHYRYADDDDDEDDDDNDDDDDDDNGCSKSRVSCRPSSRDGGGIPPSLPILYHRLSILISSCQWSSLTSQSHLIVNPPLLHHHHHHKDLKTVPSPPQFHSQGNSWRHVTDIVTTSSSTLFYS